MQEYPTFYPPPSVVLALENSITGTGKLVSQKGKNYTGYTAPAQVHRPDKRPEVFCSVHPKRPQDVLEIGSTTLNDRVLQGQMSIIKLFWYFHRHSSHSGGARFGVISTSLEQLQELEVEIRIKAGICLPHWQPGHIS